MKNIITTVLQGFIMGMAEIVPSVSGTSLGLAMGIYDDIINILKQLSDIPLIVLDILRKKSNFGDLKAHIKSMPWPFVIKIAIGVVFAFVLLSNLLSSLLVSHKSYTYAFFFGLVIFSAIIPFTELKEKNVKNILIIAVCFIATFILTNLNPLSEIANPSPVALFFMGLVAIGAMILPGLSGSFILLLFGVYQYLLITLKNFTHLVFNINDVVNIVAFVAGLGLGFVLFANILKKAFDKFTDTFLAVVIGLMLGSIGELWPFIKSTADNEFIKVLPWEVSTQDFIFTFALIVSAGVFLFILSKFLKTEESKN